MMKSHSGATEFERSVMTMLYRDLHPQCAFDTPIPPSALHASPALMSVRPSTLHAQGRRQAGRGSNATCSHRHDCMLRGALVKLLAKTVTGARVAFQLTCIFRDLGLVA